MLAYAGAVIGALIALTLALIAGLQHFAHRIEHAERGLTLLSAALLALMAMGLIAGVFRGGQRPSGPGAGSSRGGATRWWVSLRSTPTYEDAGRGP
jgi:hypothetical protein